MHDAIKAALLAVTGIAAITDLYTRQISNALVVAGFAAGVGLNLWLSGWNGFLHSLGGFGLAILMYVPLFVIRARAGGDVKLMAAAGAIVGPRDWFTLFIFASIVGGVIALAMLAGRNAFRSTFHNVMYIAKELAHFRAPYKSRSRLDIASAQASTMPHGVAIFMGAVLLLISRHY
ncbi:MAG TPA: A24 family peptidase [Bryobacteraceae bacterium]|nr:A24 family peptidase [Bryobacteraceae bacterium]